MSPERHRLQDFIDALIEARRTGLRFAPDEAMALPRSQADAYAVQRAVAAEVGHVGAFKTAVKPGQPQIVAPIYAADIHPSPATLPAPVSGGLGIELEVGLRLKTTLDGFDGSAEARARTFEPVAVIEVVDTRIAGPAVEDAMVKLADNQINRALIVGDTAEGWDGGPLAQVTARMQIGDHVVLDGSADVPGGDPIGSLLSMAAELGDHCGGLQPGQIVITGTLNPLEYFPAGTEVEGCIDGIGAVRFRIG